MKTFIVSDTHFGHKNILTFTGEDGKLIRPFSSVEEMDELMIENWNKTVSSKDKIYHLGDVVINRRCLPILDRLNGRKVLVKGNHDIFKLDDYIKYFYDIRGYHILDRLILSHIPLHEDSMNRFRGNVHGHLHRRKLEDKRYLNVAMEQINFTPIDFEEVREYYQSLD